MKKNNRYNKPWKLVGWDTFSHEEYPISEHKTQDLAEAAAAKRMQELEERQPSKSSGGQGVFGIQDRVYIQRPDGTQYQWFTTSGTLAALKSDPAVERGLRAQLAAAKNDLKKVRARARKLAAELKKRLEK